jgi:hypothetical protein
MSQNPNGVNDPHHPDFSKWQILYKLRLLHYADRDTLVRNCGITPEACSLALANLSQRGFIKGDTKDSAGDFI